MKTRQTINRIKNAIRNKYAWPGGYAIFGICNDGGILCADCMGENFRQILWSVKDNISDGWRVDGLTHAGEMDFDGDCCAHCNRELETI